MDLKKIKQNNILILETKKNKLLLLTLSIIN